MARTLNTETLDQAAKDWAAHFSLPSVFAKNNPDVAINGQEWALQNLYNMAYKDEHEYILPKFRARLGPDTLAEFETIWADRVTPRTDKVLAEELSRRLAIDLDGNHIDGVIGTVQVSKRVIGKRLTRHGMALAEWPLYAGEDEERAAGRVRERGKEGPGADPLPEVTEFYNETIHMGMPDVLYALVTNVSIAFAQAALDPALDLLDEGSVAGMIEGRTGSQPVDPNAATTGTLLFALVLTDPAFPDSADDSPNALATASSIADETSAQDTLTLGYCRASSSNSLEVALNSHIDGEAGTSGADFNFNTLAIVTGATVSITAWTVTFPQGPTAT